MDKREINPVAGKPIKEVNNIINRLKGLLGIKTDEQLSKYFNVKPNTIAAWKDRQTLDYAKLFTICKENNIDLNYVIFEKENILEDIEAVKKDVLRMIERQELQMKYFLYLLKPHLHDDPIVSFSKAIENDYEELKERMRKIDLY